MSIKQKDDYLNEELTIFDILSYLINPKSECQLITILPEYLNMPYNKNNIITSHYDSKVNVTNKIKKDGGELLLGWKINEYNYTSKKVYELEKHYIWKSDAGPNPLCLSSNHKNTFYGAKIGIHNNDINRDVKSFWFIDNNNNNNKIKISINVNSNNTELSDYNFKILIDNFKKSVFEIFYKLLSENVEKFFERGYISDKNTNNLSYHYDKRGFYINNKLLTDDFKNLKSCIIALMICDNIKKFLVLYSNISGNSGNIRYSKNWIMRRIINLNKKINEDYKNIVDFMAQETEEIWLTFSHEEKRFNISL